MADAAEQGAKIVLLPEAFIPAYPRGLGFGTVVGNRTPAGRLLWQRYWDNTIEVPSADTDMLGKAARNAGTFLAINEKPFKPVATN